MPLPEDVMRERVELVRILGEMRNSDAESPTSGTVVHDLSMCDDQVVNAVIDLSNQGARLTAAQKLADSATNGWYEVIDTHLRANRPVRYRIASRRNVGHRAPIFRDDDD